MPQNIFHRMVADAAAKAKTATPAPATTAPAPTAPPRVSPQIDEIVNKYSTQYGVDPNLVHSVIKTESGGIPTGQRGGVTSSAGARGYMQLMPDTAAQYGVTDLTDPEQNIKAGVQHLKHLSDKYGGDVTKTVAAYNAGEGNVAKYGGVPPFKETQDYVSKITQDLQNQQPVPTTAPQLGSPAITTAGSKNIFHRMVEAARTGEQKAPVRSSVVHQPLKQATTFEESVAPSASPLDWLKNISKESEQEQRKQINIEQGGKQGLAATTPTNEIPRAIRESILGAAETAGVQATPEQNVKQPFALGGPDSSGLVFSTAPVKTALSGLWNYATGKSNVEKYAKPIPPGEKPSFGAAMEPVKELAQQAVINPAKEIYTGLKTGNLEQTAHGVGGIAPVAYGAGKAVKEGISKLPTPAEPTKFVNESLYPKEVGESGVLKTPRFYKPLEINQGFSFIPARESVKNMTNALAENSGLRTKQDIQHTTNLALPDMKATEVETLKRPAGFDKNSSPHMDAAWIGEQTLQRIYEKEVAPAINSISEPIDLDPIGKQAKDALKDVKMPDAQRKALEIQIDSKLKGMVSPAEAEKIRQQLRAEAETYLSETSTKQATMEKTPQGASKAFQYAALHDALYDHVFKHSGVNLGDTFKRYGAVRELTNALWDAPVDTGLLGQIRSRFAPGTGRGMLAKAGQLGLGYLDSRNRLIRKAFESEPYKPSSEFFKGEFMPQMPAPPATGLPAGRVPPALTGGQTQIEKGPELGQQGVGPQTQIPPAPTPSQLGPAPQRGGQPHVEWADQGVRQMPARGPQPLLPGGQKALPPGPANALPGGPTITPPPQAQGQIGAGMQRGGQPMVEWSPSDVKYMPSKGPQAALPAGPRPILPPGPPPPKQLGTGGVANLPGQQGGVMTNTGPVTPQTQRPYAPSQPIQTGQPGSLSAPRNATITPTGPRTALRYANPTVKQPSLSPYQNILNNSIDMRINSIRDLAASGATESVGKSSTAGVRIGGNKQPGSSRVKTGFAESAGLKGIDESPKVIATALKNKKGALYERIRKQVADQVEAEEGEGIRQYVDQGGGQ